MKKHTFLITVITFICIYVTPAQHLTTDTTEYSDTTGTKTIELLKKADSLKRADSINIVNLNKQLEELRSTETIKRKKIEEQLSQLQTNDSLRKKRLENEVSRLKNEAVGYPIIPFKDTLYTIYTRIGSLTPFERAKIINDRLERTYKKFFLKSDSLIVQENEQTVDIYFNDQIIISFSELDELWYNNDKKSLADEFNKKIINDITRYKKSRSILSVSKDIGLVLLVILLQIMLIKGINILFRGKINRFIRKKRGDWFKGIRIKNYEIIDQNQQTSIALFLTKILRFGIIALLLYLSIPILFSIFPPTQRIAEILFGYILSPIKNIVSSFFNYIPELITIAIIFVITRYILRFIKFLAKEVQDERLKLPGFYPDWAKPTFNIVRVFVLAFMFVVIFPYLPGSDSAVFKGVSVFLGIVFSLGSSSVIGNMIAGLVITYMRPFQIGDRIKIGEVLGDVIEKTPFVTRLRTPKKEFITIPNSNILANSVVNYSTSKREDGIILYTTVTIGYDVPWRKVHQLLIDAAHKTNFINTKIEPFVLQTSLDDFFVSYQLNVHTNEPKKQPAIYSELHQNIQDSFNEAGIEILSPHYRAGRDGNTTTIPKDYKTKEYKPPGFNADKN